MRLSETESTLNDRAQQFRVIQKRLLVRFKSKNPAPLNNMDTLLRVTYQALQELGALGKNKKTKDKNFFSSFFDIFCYYTLSPFSFVLVISFYIL